MRDYIIFRELHSPDVTGYNGFDRLAQKVNEKLAEGFVLAGGVTVCSMNSSQAVTFMVAQALYLPD
ncbi:DUF1737 domain-containing protein [Chitinivorax sp. B]|uniref:DUF1737 domain-containing protein n=1 Tax=Chitinivorax sp. B TaxID=2502235 RepID=UPI0010F8ED81|nr:DUF1737 domain-containing protein [Chitinivorax sp. B]